jgi:hypothetical protein
MQRRCAHENYDAAWSRGQVWKCLDCGAVNDRILGNGWCGGMAEAVEDVANRLQRFVFPEHRSVQ